MNSSIAEQRRLSGVSHNLPGLNEASFKNAKILSKQHKGNEIHYEILDPLDGTVKAQAVGTKIDVHGHVDPRARFRVFSTIMRDLWGPAWNQLPKTVRTSLNAMLEKAGFDGNGRFISIGAALNRVMGVLAAQKIELSEPTTAHSFSGPKGSRTLYIEFHNNDDPFSPIPIGNSSLSFSWYELAKNGPYEVIAYLG
jgi:hypothetical protein